jgi:signal transduction histidine kinase/CheY-like chemotaxis protein
MPMKFLNWLLPEPFEHAVEDAYQKDNGSQMLKQIKLAMMMVAMVGLVSTIWDFPNLEADPKTWIVKFPMTVTWVGLWIYLEKRPNQAKPWLCYLSIFAMGIASADVLAMLAILGKAEYYLRLYPGIIVIFAYVYGPFAIPVRLGILFGLLTTATMLALGVSLGVPAQILGSSVFFLIAMNFAGAYTRHQLEAYARRSFLDKRAALLERMEADMARQIADYNQTLAEQAGSDITQFLRNSSHNLRQPLQALNSYSTALEMALDSGDPRLIRQVAGRLISSIDSLSKSFDRLLDISRLATEKQSAALADVPVDRILNFIAVQYNPAAEKKGIRLKIAAGQKARRQVRTDEIMLQQVLGNLVDNAIKYTRAGWVLVKARKPQGGMLRLDIIDTGTGIPEAEQAHVFKEFYRMQGQQQEYGFGIGLAYVEKAIGKLGGHRLGFKSRPGAGTHFFIDIPLAAAGTPQAGESLASEAGLAGVFVLLVDDDTDVLQALGEQLLCWGCVVEKASSVAETRCVLEDNINAPDLLITDLWLRGGETAEDVIRCAQESCGRKPVIVITGDTKPSEVAARLALHHIVLKKPFNQSLLLQGITAALAEAPGRDVKPPPGPPGSRLLARPGQSPGETPRR